MLRICHFGQSNAATVAASAIKFAHSTCGDAVSQWAHSATPSVRAWATPSSSAARRQPVRDGVVRFDVNGASGGATGSFGAVVFLGQRLDATSEDSMVEIRSSMPADVAHSVLGPGYQGPIAELAKGPHSACVVTCSVLYVHGDGFGNVHHHPLRHRLRAGLLRVLPVLELLHVQPQCRWHRQRLRRRLGQRRCLLESDAVNTDMCLPCLRQARCLPNDHTVVALFWQPRFR